MLRIAICDDEIIVVEEIRKYLEEIQKNVNMQFEIDEFYSGKRLLDANINQGFDIIYLDIEMPNMNGINTAIQIRETDVNVLLIYVSSYDGYYQQLFEVEPFRFIKKPINKRIFIDVFNKASQRIEKKNTDFHFQYNKSIIKLPLKEIMYFDSQRRTINIHSVNKTYTYYDKLDNVEKKLNNTNNENNVFLRVHKSYLVNYKYIKQWEYSKVYLYNGSMLQISEDRRKKVRKRYMELLGGTRDD